MTNFNFLLNNLSYLSSEDLVGRPMDSTCFRSASVPLLFRLRLHPLRMVATLLLILCFGVGEVWGETATLTISEYASANSWSNSSKYSTAVVSPITFTGSGGTNSTKYFSSDDTWRFYSSDSPVGRITITTTSAYKITAISSSPSKTWTKTSDTEWYHQVSSNTSFTSITVTYSAAAPATPHTVRFYTASGIYSDIEEASAGAGVTPPVMSTPCEGWAFQGWSKSQSTSSTSTTVLTTETLTAGKYYPSANTTLYPVYTKSGGTVFSQYQLITSVSGDLSGKYLLSTGTITASGTLSNKALVYETLTPGTTEKSTKEFSIVKNGNNSNYFIKFPNGHYLGNANSSADLKSNGNTSAPTTDVNHFLWTFTTSEITNLNNSTRDLKYNNTLATPAIKSYAHSGNSYPKVKLYKRIETEITYYYSYPNCCTPLGSINGSVLWSN